MLYNKSVDVSCKNQMEIISTPSGQHAEILLSNVTVNTRITISMSSNIYNLADADSSLLDVNGYQSPRRNTPGGFTLRQCRWSISNFIISKIFSLK
jgi:hypothetical protein